MMKELLHPAFDALSSFADQSDLDGAHTRVGRHVKGCTQCRAVVDEIRALGADARESSVEGAPAGLWERIERASLEPKQEPVRRTTLSTEAVEWEDAPSLRPTRNWPVPTKGSVTRIGVGLMIAAAAVVALLAWPSGKSLQASGTSRFSFSPGRPVPGGVMTVRYQPISTLRGASHLVLIGSWTARRRWVPYGTPRMADSIGVLLPKSDGSYEARVQLPSDFRTVQMAVTDSAAVEVDTDGYMLWTAIGGTRDGKASLPSLLTAVESYPFMAEFNGSFVPRQVVSPVDSLKRYFPDHPAGWAYSRQRPGKGNAMERLINFFQSSEKKYLVFHERLAPRANVSAEELHDMFVFANTIDEPGEENKWARRLAQEHPEDPRAFSDLIAALHELELKEPPHLADSIRPWFPVLDRAYQAARLKSEDAFEIRAFVSRYADSATAALWAPRFEGARGMHYWDREYEESPKLRSIAEAGWRSVVAQPCVRPPGKYSLAPLGDWLGYCQRERVFAFSFLAQARLVSGDPAAARLYADSAISTPLPREWCGRFYAPYLTGAKASLALGDTASAIRDLVTRASTWEHGGIADSAKRWLGARFDAVKFKTDGDSARKVFLACTSARETERKARRERLERDMR